MEKKSSKKIIIIAAAVVALIAIIAIALSSGSTPKKVAAKFEDAVNSQDLEEFVECFAPDFQNTLNESIEAAKEFYGDDKFSETLFGEFAVDENGNSINLDDFKFEVDVTNVETEEDSGTITVDFIYKNDGEVVREEKDLVIDVVRIDGQWYFENLKNLNNN